MYTTVVYTYYNHISLIGIFSTILSIIQTAYFPIRQRELANNIITFVNMSKQTRN
jgi:hypothetical protein